MVTRIDGNQNALRDTTQVQTNKEVQSNQGQISPSTGVEQEVTIERSFPQHKALYGPDGKTIERLLLQEIMRKSSGRRTLFKWSMANKISRRQRPFTT